MIIPAYNINDIEYRYDFDNKGIPHSYPNTPPGYSNPQILYSFNYNGRLKNSQWDRDYTWTVTPPFYILSGQNMPIVTCELIPQLNTQQEKIQTGDRQLLWRNYKYCELNLTMATWTETLNLYYQQGPLWKIEGNKTPKLETTETYTLIPQYDQTGYPPKNITNPNNYSFNIKNGKMVKFHGNLPPNGNPMIDILWYNPGTAYIAFYSSWLDEPIKFPNTLGIYVKT